MSEKRRDFRHPVNFTVEFEARNCKSVMTQTVDISLGGLGVLTQEPFPRNSDIKIKIPIKSFQLELDGKVAHSTENSKYNLYQTGISFSNQSSDFRSELANILLDLVNA